MWIYEKRLQFPVNIKETNAQLAQAIMSQIGGPDGELGAATRYLSQRYTMPYKECMAALSDIGTEELGHLEIVSTIVYQLTKNLSVDEITASGFDKYYVDHTLGIWPQAAGGVPFSTIELQSTGDAITDLYEDMAAEQKARTTYDNLLRICRDYPDVYEPIKFLRAREIVHFQRFGECLRIVTDKLDEKNFYAFNPEFDKSAPCLNMRCSS
jgi:spore coat protein JC